MARPIDYNKWNNIEVSQTTTHPIEKNEAVIDFSDFVLSYLCPYLSRMQ